MTRPACAGDEYSGLWCQENRSVALLFDEGTELALLIQGLDVAVTCLEDINERVRKNILG